MIAANSAGRAPILNPNFRYTRSGQTNVVKTFERFGWVKPNPQHQVMMRLALNGFDMECFEDKGAEGEA